MKVHRTKLHRGVTVFLVIVCCISSMLLAEWKPVVQAKSKDKSKASWQWPVDGGRVGDGFGAGRGHTGVDILKSGGSDIYAAKSGKVVYSAYHGEYGNLIVIRHKNDCYSFYSHCSKRKVKAGKTVKKGDIIGKVGSTGRASANHLHFEIRKGNAVSGLNNSSVFLLKATNPMRKF